MTDKEINKDQTETEELGTEDKTEEPDAEERAEEPGTDEKTEEGAEDEADEPDTDEKTEEPDIEEEPADYSEALKTKIEAAEQESRESHDRLLRVSAEFENYKKRSAREMESFKKFANESIIKELLPVVDNLERAIDSSANLKDADNGIAEGVNMTLKEILKVFEKFGIKPIESIGEAFDPSLHEAVMQEESDEYPGNSVLRELQRGYTIHDRLLRPAMVIVSKAKPVSEDENE
ncbi:nucleotide exchange factor GrpE [Desulfococcaceae bacterium HSG8]|nr:nucleotide exchange factor GrpE [Desulfococcaceae bacterium HSG8]